MNDAHLARFQALAGQAEKEGYRFLDRMVTEWKAGTLDFSGPGEVAVVVEVADEIVGVGGLCRDPYADSQRIGRIRHMYIHPAHRGSGVGAMLLTKIMAHHTVHFDRLRLRAANARSGKFYELHGFRPTLTEQHCTHVFG